MKSKFVTGGALAALAAGLALIAVPAQARPNDRDDNRHQQREDSGQHQRPADAGQRGQGSHDRAPAATQAPQAAPPQARQQQWGHWSQAQQQQRSNAPQAREQRQQRNWNGQARQQQRSDGQARQTDQTQHWNGGQRTSRNGSYVDPNRNTTYRGGGDRNWQGSRSGNDRNWQGSRGGNDRSYRDGNRDNRQWDRNWRSNSRYDWQRYRSSNRNAYHVGRYYAPYRNYSYRRLSIGFSLDPLFFGQDYWIGDPGYYRLPDVYGPYRWVRYYDDALLVDIYSGEVVDVIYDFFW